MTGAGDDVNKARWFRGLTVAVALVALAGCAAQQAYRRAEAQARRENWDPAVLEYSKALALDPGNTRYGVALERAKLKASAQHFEKGKRYATSGQWDLAVAEYQQTLILNPGNQHAASELEKAMRQLQRRSEGAADIQRLKDKVARKNLGPPRLSPKSNIPILLQFKDQPVGKILEAIGKASGINIIFDDKVELNKNVTVDLGNVTLEKALDILMLQTKNFYKVLDTSTLLIAPDQRQRRQELEDQVIRTFYLSSGDVKQVQTLVRALLNTRKIADNDKLNSVTIQDTPDKVAIAERIIEANDKAKGEIIIDVELLEINRTLVRTLGLDLSSKRLGLTFVDGKQAVPLNNLNILKQTGNWLLGVIPSVTLDFLKSDSDSKSIAKPQLRVTEGEKAEILIGDRVPIPTTSFNTGATTAIGGVNTVIPITSFTYQNVGITVQIEPRVHHNKEVTLKVEVEISQIAGEIQTGAGVSQPIIGTRNIKTVIRLRDGETNLLAGLIRREDTDARSGIPGLIDTPVLGSIFSSSNKKKTETDIILTLTPYIIRIPDITEDDLTTLWVGSEENMKLRGPARNALGESPFAPESEAAAAPVETPTRPKLPPLGPPAIPEPKPEVPPAPAPEPPEPPQTGGAAAPATGTGSPAEPAPAEEAAPEEEPPPVESEEPPPGEAEEPPAQPPAPDQAPQGLAVVRMVPSSPTVRVGDRVVVELRIENAEGVGSVPFHLKYNRQVLEFVPPGSEGPFLGSDGTATMFLARDTTSGGEVVVGLSRLGGGEGVSGSGTLATLQFRAVNSGDCGLSFVAASVKDPRARNLPSSFLAAAVQVEP